LPSNRRIDAANASNFAGESFRALAVLLPVEDASLAEHVGADVQNDLDADLETAFGRRLERVVGEE
jgi:hypothetical protein